MEAKTSEWRPGPTVCRCCLTEGCYKDISTEYFWMGKREVYSEMLSETFSVSISYSKSGGPNSQSRLICEQCISRLRDAADFKRQVVECEKMFMQHLDPGTSSVVEFSVPQVESSEKVKLERVKVEKVASDDDFDDGGFPEDDDDDDDLDDQPLMKLASKIPKKESLDLRDLLDNTKLVLKRKAPPTSKTKPVVPTKKLKSKKEVKPAPSKAKAVAKPAPKPVEKKKKGTAEEKRDVSPEARPIKIVWKRKQGALTEDKANAAFILEHSNAVVFRWQRGKFMCAYCPKICANVAEVRTHSVTHNPLDLLLKPIKEVRNSFPLRVDITNLTCSVCNHAVNTVDNLKSHLRETHGKIANEKYTDGLIPFILTGKDYSCLHCKEVFEGFMSLFIHMNQHYQSFVCDECGKGYSANHKLRAHQRTHVLGKFACSRCDLIFPNSIVRNRHITSVHGRKERYRCPICDSYFDSYHSRLRHLDRVHGQKSEYKCSLCTSVFGSGALRNSHMRVVHFKKKKIPNVQ